MNVRDKKLGKTVSVYDKNCLNKPCYWPREHPGVYTQGQGYRKMKGFDNYWVCGTRESKGCPD